MRQPAQMLRAVVRSFSGSRLYLSVTALIETTISIAARGFSKNTKVERHHIVIPTNGHGNIGDQAMFEAYLQSVPFPVVAIFKSRDALVVPAWRKQPVRIVVLPRLVGGVPTLRVRTMVKYCSLLRDAISVSVVGADIMDGGYDRRESIFRSRALTIASRLGVPGRVLGFSWNGVADPLTISALRRASQTATLYARDPVSFARLQSDNMANLELAADAAFVLVRDESDAHLKGWLRDDASAPLAVINASGLIMNSVDLTGDYVKIVEALLANGYKVVLTPHVLRHGDDDRLACKAIATHFKSANVYLVDRKLSPSSVGWLTSQATLTLSGRMHLAILSMNRGTPSITFSTQGKVEGLLQSFGLPALCVEPKVGMSADVLRLVTDSALHAGVWRSSIVTTLPRVRSLAIKNYAGLF